jgi:TRAP-type uncharacterized transport system substrate-binding protein
MARCKLAFYCFLVLWIPSALPASAQSASDVLTIAQLAAPKRAQPIPNKPVSIEEADKAARINNWTIGLAGGLLEGTFSKYAADLGKALDDGENLRVLPIISYGAVGNVTDLVYLKGVDFAITYADVLDHFKNVEKIPGIERRVNYVIPMFLGPVHVYVRPEIKTFQDLVGKKFGFNTVGSAANYTGGIVFDRLGIKVERVFMNNSLALDAMRKGELAGIVHVVGTPNELFAKLKPEPGFHFLPVPFDSKFEDYYIPSELTSKDYPDLIPEGQPVQTIAVAALLAVYNWRPDTDRYRRCVRFVEYLFERFDKLKGPSFQRDWKQMNLAGTIPGWTRFPPAQEMINRISAARVNVDPVLARSQAVRAAPNNPAEQERLFHQFLQWSKEQKRP